MMMADERGRVWAEAMAELEATKEELERQLEQEQRRMRGERRESPLNKIRINRRGSIRGRFHHGFDAASRMPMPMLLRRCQPHQFQVAFRVSMQFSMQWFHAMAEFNMWWRTGIDAIDHTRLVFDFPGLNSSMSMMSMFSSVASMQTVTRSGTSTLKQSTGRIPPLAEKQPGDLS